MSRIIINSQSATGRFESIDSNFGELYTAGASASAAITNMLGAWASYTTTATPATGSFTTATTTGAQRTVGKTVDFRLVCTVTTVNTGTSPVSITLPATANAATIAVASTASGAVLGKLSAASNAVSVSLASLVNGTVITVSGTYESQ